MVKIFMGKAVVDRFHEPVFLAVHALAIGFSRMRGDDLLERLSPLDAGFYFGRNVHEHVPIRAQLGRGRDGPVGRNDSRMIVRHRKRRIDALDHSLDTASAAPVDEREDVVEEHVAHRDDVRLSEPDQSVAVGMRIGDMPELDPFAALSKNQLLIINHSWQRFRRIGRNVRIVSSHELRSGAANPNVALSDNVRSLRSE